MKRNFVVGLFGGLIGSAMLLIVLSAAGIVGARSSDVTQSDVSHVNSVTAATLTSTFTYQGQLIGSGSPISNTCDFQFSLYDALSAGSRIGITQTVSGVNLSRGLFTTLLNTGDQFGDTAFNGDARWLSIGVRCPASAGLYTTLSPRQPLTSLPFALPGLRTFPNATSPNIIGGYSGNVISNTIVGGTIGGGGASGLLNRVQAEFATIGGGVNNIASGDQATVGGGSGNTASGNIATIGGGNGNTASNFYATIGGGFNSTASANSATVGGGSGNTASNTFATVGGGGSNQANRFATTIGGGYSNQANGDAATVGGGYGNQANGDDATVSGGFINVASGYGSTIPGGLNNQASMTHTFAAGYKAQAFHQGAFVWSDSTGTDFASTANDQFFVRASGGIYFFASPSGFGGGHCYLPANGTGWTCSSDRNLKEHFSAIDPQAVLQKLNTIPITQWNMKGASVPHVGAMAQDFYAAFGLGEDDTHINTTDAQGVAFAAIQGLYQVVQAKDATIASLQKQIDVLHIRLAKVEQNTIAGNSSAQSGPFGVSMLLSAIAFAGFAVMWIQQRRSKRGQV